MKCHEIIQTLQHQTQNRASSKVHQNAPNAARAHHCSDHSVSIDQFQCLVRPNRQIHLVLLHSDSIDLCKAATDNPIHRLGTVHLCVLAHLPIALWCAIRHIGYVYIMYTKTLSIETHNQISDFGSSHTCTSVVPSVDVPRLCILTLCGILLETSVLLVQNPIVFKQKKSVRVGSTLKIVRMEPAPQCLSGWCKMMYELLCICGVFVSLSSPICICCWCISRTYIYVSMAHCMGDISAQTSQSMIH